MTTPIPDRVDDPKDAVLWAVYSKLQDIDDNPSSRIAFASSIAINQHFSTDHPVFDHELGLLREILHIEVPKETAAPVESGKREELVVEDTFRDL
jgi:hypothetical protein